mgnify:FL=1
MQMRLLAHSACLALIARTGPCEQRSDERQDGEDRIEDESAGVALKPGQEIGCRAFDREKADMSELAQHPRSALDQISPVACTRFKSCNTPN